MAFLDRLRAFVQRPVLDPGKEVAIADTRLGFFSGFSFIPYNPDELAKQKGGLRLYDKMREDEQVKACLTLKKCAIIGPGWALEPGDDSDAAGALAEQLTDDLQAMRGTFEDDLWGMLSALEYGFSCSEKVFALTDGRVTLSAVKARAPHDIDFKVDLFGNIEAVVQRQPAGTVDLALDRFVHFVHQPEFENPYGRSDLREAYRAWFAKANVWQWWVVFAERFAIPIAKGTHPKSQDAVKLAEFLTLLKQLQANTSLRLEEGWDVNLIESARDPKQFFESAINRFDLAICKALLLPDKLGLVGGTVEAGSYSLAQTQGDVFVLSLDLLRKRLQAAVQEQLILQLAALSAPSVAPPEFKLLPLSEDNRQALVDVWSKALTAGAVQMGLDDENHVRQLLGFPEVDEDEQRRRQEEAARAQEQAAAQQANRNGNGNGGGGGGGKPEDRKAEMAEPAPLPTTFWRTPTALEQRTDMAEKRATIEAQTSALGDILAEGAQALVEDVTATAERLRLFPGQDPAVVSQLAVSQDARARLTAAVAAELQAAHRMGIMQARAELQRARRTFSEASLKFAQRPGLIGQQTQTFFRAKALLVTGVLSEDILKKAKVVLLQALTQDKTPRQVLFELSESLADFLPAKDAAGRAVNVPARLETIARTNIADAIGQARYTTFTDPDLGGFVRAFRYSAILDDRVRKTHAAWDGVTRSVDDPIWYQPDRRPPDGFNCRCQLVPVTAGDDAELTPDEDLPLDTAGADVFPDPGFR